MAATFTAGVNWGTASTQTLTASLLATYINGTITTNIGTAELDDGAKPFFSGSAPPSDGRATDYWYDIGNRLVNRLDGGVWQPIYQGRVLFNTGVTLPLGSVVAHGLSASSISRNNTARWAGLFGVTVTTIGQTQSGLIRFNGIGSVLVTGTCTAGDPLVAFGIGGVGGAAISAVVFSGFTGVLNPNKRYCDFAFALWNNAGAAGTVTCLIYR